MISIAWDIVVETGEGVFGVDGLWEMVLGFVELRQWKGCFTNAVRGVENQKKKKYLKYFNKIVYKIKSRR